MFAPRRCARYRSPSGQFREQSGVDDKPTLASQGIDKNLAHQARVLGACMVRSTWGAMCSSRTHDEHTTKD
jgi:hypothetical protein